MHGCWGKTPVCSRTVPISSVTDSQTIAKELEIDRIESAWVAAAFHRSRWRFPAASVRSVHPGATKGRRAVLGDQPRTVQRAPIATGSFGPCWSRDAACRRSTCRHAVPFQNPWSHDLPPAVSGFLSELPTPSRERSCTRRFRRLGCGIGAHARGRKRRAKIGRSGSPRSIPRRDTASRTNAESRALGAGAPALTRHSRLLVAPTERRSAAAPRTSDRRRGASG